MIIKQAYSIPHGSKCLAKTYLGYLDYLGYHKGRCKYFLRMYLDPCESNLQRATQVESNKQTTRGRLLMMLKGAMNSSPAWHSRSMGISVAEQLIKT